MRKIVAILGTLLIATVIIISGSAVAGWYYAFYVDSYQDCKNRFDALYEPDGSHATIGINEPNLTLGWIILDLGEQTGMLGGQEFTVYASSSVKETYKIRLISTHKVTYSSWWTGCDDTKNEDFTAPETPPQGIWRYYEIHSEEGNNSDENDPIYGSEIDAVGYDQV
jgi:hypothetical protein